jgi:glutamate-5-semialdehyde dehydrogenase
MNLKDKAKLAASGLDALAASSVLTRNRILLGWADDIAKNIPKLLEANQKDVENARKGGLSAALIDRLSLSEKSCLSLSESLREVASLPDPLGPVEDMKRLPNGLTVGRMRIPLGLIAFICEARPGAVAEAAAMALKSGNAILIKPGKEAAFSSGLLGEIMGETLSRSELPSSLVTVLADMERADVLELIQMEDLLDLIIPRGGEGLIRFVAENARVPVLKHYKGVCHVYVDECADLKMALEIVINAKAQRPGTCNALECLLVSDKVADAFLPMLAPKLLAHKIKIKASKEAYSILSPLMGKEAEEASESDYFKEYLDLILNVKTTKSMEEALLHIKTHGSRHTESIVTKDAARAFRFLRAADASCVMHNASTRLNDGGHLGLGAEIGISTTKLHAYGPMGLSELTSRKFMVLGEGNLRS